MKTTRKYIHIFKERLKLRDNTNVREDVKRMNPSYCFDMGINWENYFGKLAVSTKVEHMYPLGPSNLVYCEFSFIFIPNRKACICALRERTRRFIVAIFKIVKNWNQPNCLSTTATINKVLYFHILSADTVRWAWTNNSFMLQRRWISQKYWMKEDTSF